jgi:hypothetical protein
VTQIRRLSNERSIAPFLSYLAPLSIRLFFLFTFLLDRFFFDLHPGLDLVGARGRET